MTSPETNISRNFDGAPFFSSFSFFSSSFFLSDVTANYHRTNVFIFTAITERII